jgi:hypothetical protein
MRKNLKMLTTLLLACSIIWGNAQNQPIQLNINAGERIATVNKFFNGTNIEDLNNQTNGGIFSQLLHGEVFEENIDVDFLNLERGDYSKIYVVLDERKTPHLITQSDIYHRINWNNLEDKYDFYSKDIYDSTPFQNGVKEISGWRFPGRFLPFDSLPDNIQRTMTERINGKEQISRYWSKSIVGSPEYKYELIRDNQAYIGRQTQQISFQGGTGEVGLTNHGLYRMGIAYEKNKPYDGVLRVMSNSPVTIYLTLRNEEGKVIAEKTYSLKGDGSYEKIIFELIPDEDTSNGSFGISLRSPGTIKLGFAFLQPGQWGRANSYPLRKSFTDALIEQGITAIRYNGSMVDVGADKHLYRWKKMLGPVDERRIVYRSGFNIYATHSFGIIEMLQAAEVIDADAIIGMSMDETYKDIKDFVEYVNGPVTSEWGALRAKHGHPEPYKLKYIQVDNERRVTRGYVECMKKFAEAAWEIDPNMTIMTSLNIGRDGRYNRGTSQYGLISEMVGWFISKGKESRLAWDPHYSGSRQFADDKEWFESEMGIILQQELAKDYPGFKLNLHPMEENGSRCDWDRGLAHANNWNTLQRYGDCFKMLGTANTFQPHGLHYMWDQGRIHYTADKIWFQPSAHIDKMMMETWKPIVVAASSSDKALDITAKINENKTEMTIYVVNNSDQSLNAILDIENFKFKSRAEIQTIGNCELTEYNTIDNMNNVVFKPSIATIAKKNAKYTFPRYSYTVITLKR